MARAIGVLSGSAAAHLPRPLAGLGRFFAMYWRELTRDATRPYRPELHYMRGPGPAWRAKNPHTHDPAHGSPHGLPPA